MWSNSALRVTNSETWQQQIGNQRDWVWRGWQTRYTYIRAKQNCQSPRPQETVNPVSISQPPILLIHGFGASIGHWRQNFGVLSQEHTVYALDLLGFGASEKAIATYNVNLWVEQIYEFWQTFIQEPVILIGNSIGSLISLAAAASYPEMVKAVVAISLPDPGLQKEAIPPRLLPFVETVQNIIASPPLLRPIFYLVRQPAIIRRWVKLAYANPDSITDELVDILAGPPSDRGSARAFCILFRVMGSTKLGPSVKAILPDLEIPILLIWGQQDRLIPASVAKPEELMEYNSHLKLVKLENAGHCPHDECPEKVNQLILNWIGEWQLENA
jgi:pimeloyl-ACP methyl ester carboxylesterase